MTPTIAFDTRALDAAIAEKLARKPGELAAIANQAAFNVAARAMKATRQADGRKVHSYLRAWVNAPVVNGAVKSQPSNRFGSRHKRAARQLRRVTLIAQAIFFKKHGHGIGKGKSQKRRKILSTAKNAKPGKVKMGSDYGQAMIRYVGKIFNKNVRSVGYLKAVWVDALRTLAPTARFKGLATGLKYGVRWKTGSAYGKAVAAVPGKSSMAVLNVGATAPRMTVRASAEVKAALVEAIAAEAAEMVRHERAILEGKL